MKSKMCLLAAILPLGACGMMSRERPAVEVAPPPLVIPAECRVDPVAPVETDPPVLPALPAVTSPEYLTRRTQRAELAGLFFQGERDAIREAYDTNAATQRVCAQWAREH